MPGKKFDGVIEAVRYAPDGQIKVVRAFERRGATFTDHVLLDRAALVERLKLGRKFVTGQRKQFLASTFDTYKDVTLSKANGQEFISTNASAGRDLLEEVPLF